MCCTPVYLGDTILFPDLDTFKELGAGQALSDYIAYNNVPMGVTHFRGRLFITMPRRRPGIPSTLNYVHTKSTKGSSPSMRPYPSIEINQLHVIINFLFNVIKIIASKISFRKNYILLNKQLMKINELLGSTIYEYFSQ